MCPFSKYRFIQGKVPDTFSNEFVAQNAIVQTSSAEFLQYLLLKVTDSKFVLVNLPSLTCILGKQAKSPLQFTIRFCKIWLKLFLQVVLYYRYSNHI